MTVETQVASQAGTLWTVLGSVLSFIFGFLSAVFSEPARQWFFRPILSLSFSNSDGHVSKTDTAGPSGNGPRAFYVRIKVVNQKRRIARQCRAYLVNVEKKNANGVFEPTKYVDSIQLAWSCQQPGKAREPKDLPNGVVQYVDLFATFEDLTNAAAGNFIPQIDPFPFRYTELFNVAEKTLRFTVQVSGDGVEPVSIKVVFVWKRKWDSFDVYHEE